MYDTKIRTISILTAALVFLLPIGCSRDSAQKSRYDMEKLAYLARKQAEKINIQPQLATADDSLALKDALHGVLDFYFERRNTPAVAADPKIAADMARLAIGVQLQLADFYAVQGKSDSVISAYRRIGSDIPAGREESARAGMALAITYRSLQQFDSTLAVYDRVLADYYPPIDSLDRTNPDVVAIPIDRLKIAQGIGDNARAQRFTQQALDYYNRLLTEFSSNDQLARVARISTSRIYTMTEQWDKAIGQLLQIKDSTGQTDVAAEILIANIYSGPLDQGDRAIDLYRRILQREPDSSVIGTTMLRLGRALMARKDYDEGRRVLADLKKKFATRPQLVASAQYDYALSFESEGRWDRALSELQWLLENHPYAEDAFRAASYIPRHFTRENDQKMFDIWYNRAENFYLEAARVKQGQPIEAAAYSYLAELYRVNKQWNKALETLEKIHSLVPKTPLGARALYNAAAVAYQELRDSAMAQRYLDQIRRDFGTADSTVVLEENKSDLNPKSIE